MAIQRKTSSSFGRGQGSYRPVWGRQRTSNLRNGIAIELIRLAYFMLENTEEGIPLRRELHNQGGC